MTKNTEQPTTTPRMSIVKKAALVATALALATGIGLAVNQDLQRQAAKAGGAKAAEIEIPGAELTTGTADTLAEQWSMSDADLAAVEELFNPTSLMGNPAAFASKDTALALASAVVNRSVRQSLDLQGNTEMPRQELLDIVGRALGLAHDFDNSCGIKLTDRATETDYRMALAMSKHFKAKICVPAGAKVQDGKTLLELFLEGTYAPMSVHVMGLQKGMKLQDPAELDAASKAHARRALSGLGVPG